ncbi:MAG: hypothetical protein PHY93_20590, partial [Bacteriovorax sp.]|nr:hypothetical protein [Bacteriovorax sp.]
EKDYLGKDLFDKQRELDGQIKQLELALKDKRFFGRVEEIQGYLNGLKKELIQVNLKIKNLINQSKNRENGGAQMYPRESVKEKVGFDGKYVDDMESGVAVKKLHNLDEVAGMNQQRAVAMFQDFARRLIGTLGIKDKSSYVTAEKVIKDFLPRFSEYFPDDMNEGAGLITKQTQRFVYPDPIENVKNYIRVVRKPDTDEFVVRWYENGKFNEDKSYFTDDAADAWNTFALMKMQVDKANNPNLNNGVNEMSDSGGAGAYQTPFAFSKNKMGSSRAIASAKKYGKVVKSISEKK